MHISVRDKREFQKEIFDWYKINKRDLPWRNLSVSKIDNCRDPYAILVSEVMLQQTQVSRVIPKYEAWMQMFPTVHDLASASVTEVLSAWSGLGYNRRALNLKKAAEIVGKEYAGIFPQSEIELRKLPGIGVYTARAILCFAFNQAVPVVDINVKKVILHRFIKKQNAMDKEIEAIAQRLLPAQDAYNWNQALMDYSSIVLKNEKIVIPKQSKFIGSHRYYRGQILKLLLQQHAIPLSSLGTQLKKDFSDAQLQWLQTLLEELEHEGFITVQNGQISFPNPEEK